MRSKTAEYMGSVLPDGHLSLPEDIRKELGLVTHGTVKVRLRVESGNLDRTQQAWDLFRDLGKDAVVGKLLGASEKHDAYLYGKTRRERSSSTRALGMPSKTLVGVLALWTRFPDAQEVRPTDRGGMF